MSAVKSHIRAFAKLAVGRMVEHQLMLIEVAPCEFQYLLVHRCDAKRENFDTYIWKWNASSERAKQQTLQTIGILACNPDVLFDWHDGAILTQFVRMTAAVLDVDFFEGLRDDSPSNFPFSV